MIIVKKSIITMKRDKTITEKFSENKKIGD